MGRGTFAFAFAALAAGCAGETPAAHAPAAQHAAPPAPQTESQRFATFVDQWLDLFATRHPSIAAGNGIHTHDDKLEDFSAVAIEREVRLLRRDRARLATFDESKLDEGERVDRRILLGIVDAWQLDLVEVQTWRNNPMIYAAAIADGLHALLTMENDEPRARLWHTVLKLRQVPALLSAARVNIGSPPAVYARRAAEQLRAAALLLDEFPRVFSSITIDDRRLGAEYAAASKQARAQMESYAGELEAAAATSKAPFAIGKDALLARWRDEEMIELPLERMVEIGQKALAETEQRFAEAAKTAAPGAATPREAWAKVSKDHPERGHVVDAARAAEEELTAFVRAKELATMPRADLPVVAPAPDFDLGFASMHASPPLETRPVKSFFYVTDARADWPPEKQEAWLERFNFASLAIVTAHEVMPGHWLHAMTMRHTKSKIRRIWVGLNPFPQPSSGQDGWAHYAEQLVVDEGFAADRPAVRLAQLEEALVRICRLLTSTWMHTAGMSVDDAAKFFETHAYLSPPIARREAERGTYDPTSGVYFLGKLALLRLRDDVKAAENGHFDLRFFHDRVMEQGIAPWWAHRQLFFPGDTRPVLD